MHDKRCHFKEESISLTVCVKVYAVQAAIAGWTHTRVCENVSVQSSKARRWENVILEPTVKGFKLIHKYCKTTSWLILKAEQKQVPAPQLLHAHCSYCWKDMRIRTCVCVRVWQRRAEDIFRHRKKGFVGVFAMSILTILTPPSYCCSKLHFI